MAMISDQSVGIEKGMMTTIHSYTGDQPTLDTMHKDLYRARAAALSQIPTSTGAAKAIGLVLPELKGKLDGISVRVPTPNVSLVVLNFQARRKTTRDEINEAMIAASEGALKGIMTVTHHPLVSSDLNHDPHSATILLDQTKVIDDTFVNVMGWYDNEWGFSNRMVDVALAFAETL
jgi:glyceraldehyde 3-phosphate dehydrogenase